MADEGSQPIFKRTAACPSVKYLLLLSKFIEVPVLRVKAIIRSNVLEPLCVRSSLETHWTRLGKHARYAGLAMDAQSRFKRCWVEDGTESPYLPLLGEGGRRAERVANGSPHPPRTAYVRPDTALMARPRGAYHGQGGGGRGPEGWGGGGAAGEGLKGAPCGLRRGSSRSRREAMRRGKGEAGPGGAG